MATPPKTILPAVVEGDTWPGIPALGPVTIDGDAPTFPAALVRLHFRRVNDPAATGLDLSSAPGGGITIVNAGTWFFSVSPIAYPAFTLAQGNWEADLEITDSAGVRTTYAVFLLPVLRQITR
jgi:hypothetical protein